MPIQVASFLIPRNGQTWYILEDKYLKGGLRICADEAERTAIHPASLKQGMLVLLISDNKLYQLTDVANSTWVEYKASAPQINPFYTHIQSSPNDVWTVAHGKNNRHFTVNVFDDDGRSLFPDAVTIIDENTVEVRFLYPIAGHCVFGFDIPVST
jgi:hypothetical protein